MAKPFGRVSVIVPCYNAAAYLGAALDSLLAQTPPPFEIIVIDDGSSDGSAALAGSYGAPVLCHSQINQGIAGARNQGLRLARGDLIAFLDADDLWPAHSLAVRLAELERTPDLDGVFGLVESFACPNLSAAEIQGLQAIPGIQAGRLAGASLWRRSAFDEVGEFNTSFTVGETMDWVARAEELGLVLGQVPQVVLRRRIHSANTVRKAEQLKADYLRLLRASLTRRRPAAQGAGQTD